MKEQPQGVTSLFTKKVVMTKPRQFASCTEAKL